MIALGARSLEDVSEWDNAKCVAYVQAVWKEFGGNAEECTQCQDAVRAAGVTGADFHRIVKLENAFSERNAKKAIEKLGRKEGPGKTITKVRGENEERERAERGQGRAERVVLLYNAKKNPCPF